LRVNSAPDYKVKLEAELKEMRDSELCSRRRREGIETGKTKRSNNRSVKKSPARVTFRLCAG